MIDFEIKKIQAVTGKLFIQDRERLKPVELAEITVEIKGTIRTFPTGRGGEFYIEDIAPGTYEVWFLLDGHHHVFELVIPESDDMIIDLGGITL